MSGLITLDLEEITKGFSAPDKRIVMSALKGVSMGTNTLSDRIRIFLAGDSENVRLASGVLQQDERTTRIAFAEKHCAKKVRDWIEAQELSLEEFIDANSCESRVGLCELLGGQWIENDAIPDWV